MALLVEEVQPVNRFTGKGTRGQRKGELDTLAKPPFCTGWAAGMKPSSLHATQTILYSAIQDKATGKRGHSAWTKGEYPQSGFLHTLLVYTHYLFISWLLLTITASTASYGNDSYNKIKA